MVGVHIIDHFPKVNVLEHANVILGLIPLKTADRFAESVITLIEAPCPPKLTLLLIFASFYTLSLLQDSQQGANNENQRI